MTAASKNTCRAPRNLMIFRLGSSTAVTVFLTLGFGATAAWSDISASVGGISAGVSAGGSGIRAGVSVGGTSGVRAGAAIGGTSGIRAGATVGGTSGVRAGVGVGGTSGVTAGVGVGTGTGVGVGVGTDPGTPTVNPPPVVTPVVTTPATVRKPVTAKMRCAKNGNSQVYNGVPVADRSGALIGWIHDTRLDQNLNVSGIRLQTVDNRCVALVGGNFRMAGGTMRVDAYAADMR